jgi:hypothetical protein
MKRLRQNQQGLLDTQTLVVLLLVVALTLGCFWYVAGHRQVSKAKTQKTTEVPKLDSMAVKSLENDLAPQRYHDDAGQFTISYPSAWHIEKTSTGSGSTIINTATLTSPSGNTKLYLDFRRNYTAPDCIQDYYDVPFTSTNRCFSAEYLTADDIHAPDMFDEKWYLSHYHFKTITINAKELYASCLILGKPALNQPKMGFFIDHPVNQVSVDGYLSACVDAGTQATDYSKPEVQAAESILRSLRFDS